MTIQGRRRTSEHRARLDAEVRAEVETLTTKAPTTGQATRRSWITVERVEQHAHNGLNAQERAVADLRAMQAADPTRDLVVQHVAEGVLSGERSVVQTIGDAEHYRMRARVREELRRLDAESKKASEAHDAAVTHIGEVQVAMAACLEAEGEELSGKVEWHAKRLSRATYEVQEARYKDGCAHHAFQAACRLAEVLRFIREGEREFYTPPGQLSRAALVETFGDHVYEATLRSSGDSNRAVIARTEALAQGYGDYGPEGTAVFEAWVKSQSQDTREP